MTRNDTRKSTAIEALGHGFSVTDASDKAGVTRKTIYRWLGDDNFSDAVSEKQREVLERVSGRLSALALQALDTLDDLMESRNENIRLRASQSVLGRFTEILEVLRLEDRVKVLEDRVERK